MNKLCVLLLMAGLLSGCFGSTWNHLDELPDADGGGKVLNETGNDDQLVLGGPNRGLSYNSSF